MKRFLKAAALATAATAAFVAPMAAHSQAWPTKPVKIIVPSPPGGSPDQIARAIGQKLSIAWGQPVVVETSLALADSRLRPRRSRAMGTGGPALSGTRRFGVIDLDTWAFGHSSSSIRLTLLPSALSARK